ncbi:epoxide hydrolase-like protein [Anaeramoeba ignava]|uniref:Epoxide hydrolase-like protein n=1 Tax=Anaeramoeba ignava TaxID=1746090 RepID=A0A9Q0LKP2_ANAIG|nr:epoxide hydrolase-like protein [Anaeramoeba ignava]
MIHNKESIPTIIGSTIGMTGSLIFIISYSILKKMRDSARKFIFTLAICDFFLAFFAILPGPSSDLLCKFQGFFFSFTFAASCSLIFLTSLVFYLKIRYGKNVDQSKKFFIIGIIIIVIICLLASSLFVIFGEIGPGNTHWCWITKIRIEPIIYSIVWSTLLATLILYSIIFCKLKQNPKYSKSFQYKIFALGWIYLFTELWTSVKRGRQLADPKVEDNLFLDVMQAVLTPMLGLWDSVFFVFGDKNVRSLLKFKFKYKTRKYKQLKVIVLDNPNIIEFFDHPKTETETENETENEDYY